MVRGAQLSGLLILTICGSLFFFPPVMATEGYWRRIDTDIAAYFQELPGRGQVVYHRSRGPEDLWTINFTVSGFGLRPTTLLVCNATGYHAWNTSHSKSGCALVAQVHQRLDTQIELDHASEWFVVLNNTVGPPIYYTLVVTHYHWTTSTDPTDFINQVGDFVWWFAIVLVIAIILIPCLCGCTCIRRLRRGGQGNKVEIHQYFYPTPRQHNEDEEEDTERDYW